MRRAACLTVASALAAVRLAAQPIPGVRVERIAVPTDRGWHARVVRTTPLAVTSTRAPAVLFIPWLSCDPVEVPGPTDDGYIRFTRDLATRSGMIVDRVEKPGVDGSEGPACGASTLADDLAAFRAALRHLRATPGVDTTRVYLVGGSIGGTEAVMLAADRPREVRGVVSVNSFAEPWRTHMLGFERRRLTLLGTRPDSVGRALRAFALLYREYLDSGRTPGEVARAHPAVRAVWYDSADGQFGRPARYFQEVARLDVAGALRRLAVPALFVSGEYDWVMSGDEARVAARTVNAAHPGLATAITYPHLSHGLHTFASPLDAFRGVSGSYEPRVAEDVVQWMRAH